MKRVRFVLVAVLVVLTACGNPSLPPAQNYATVSGRIFDAASNAPVAGAVITVSTVLTATSGADGTYKISNVPIGQNEAFVNAPSGFHAATSQFALSLQPGESYTLNIPLTKS